MCYGSIGAKCFNRTKVDNTQTSRSLLSSVILLLFTVFLAFCSVNLLLAGSWNLFGEFFGTRILASSASFFWNFIPRAEALDSALFLFPALFKTFLFCPHVKILPPLKLMLPSSSTFDPFLHPLHHLSLPLIQLRTWVSFSWSFSSFSSIVVIIPQVPVPKRTSLANSLAAKFLNLSNSVSPNTTHYHSHTPDLIIMGKQRLTCTFLTKTSIPSSHLMPSDPVFLLVITPLKTFSSQLLSFPSAHHLSHYFSSFLIQPSFHKHLFNIFCQNVQLTWTPLCPTLGGWGILEEGM